MSAKKKLRRFLDQAKNAPEGCQFEVGLAFDIENGWRVYERIHDAALMMSPKQARGIADTYDKIGRRSEWKREAASLSWVPIELRKLAEECEQKNARKDVPEGYVEAMPTSGSS